MPRSKYADIRMPHETHDEEMKISPNAHGAACANRSVVVATDMALTALLQGRPK